MIEFNHAYEDFQTISITLPGEYSVMCQNSNNGK